MFDIFVTAVNAVIPIILLILLGYVLKRLKFLNRDFIKTGNKFVFKVCLPCMLFINVYDKMNTFADIRWDLVIYVLVVLFVVFGLGLLTAVLTTKDNKRRGVILQCTFRSNFAIIGLSLVASLGGDEAMASIISAFTIPMFNVLAVIALTVFVANDKPKLDENSLVENSSGTTEEAVLKPAKGGTVKTIIINIIKNPLIIGVVTGLVFVGIREIERACCGGEVPFRFDNQFKFVYSAVSFIKQIASPLALVVMGGAFEFSAIKGMTKEIIVGTLWRIVITPLIGIGCAVLIYNYSNLFVAAPDYATLIALFGSPVAVSSAIMAGQMNNDEQLGAQLVVWTSLCSIVTVFVTVFILMSCGLITI